MQLLSTPTAIKSRFNSLLRDCESVSFAVAWASCGFDTCNRLLESRDKIRRGVVGTHFYQTDPEFIKEFRPSRKVKFIMNPSGVFHPKVYLFEGKNGDWNCLIGSANFTAGGFENNSEMLVHIQGADDTTGSMAATVREQIKSYFSEAGASFASDIDLDRYRYWKERFKRPFEKAQGNFGTKKTKKELVDIDLLNVDWPEFLAEVQKDAHHSIDGRIEVLGAAHSLFEEHGSLARMPIEARRGIGGYAESDGMPWGWFGSMRGAGEFKKLMNRHPAELSDALDQIPLVGRVQRADYDAFIGRYVAAFPLKGKVPTRHGLATATRLLAMKRPDYFVCLDSANRAGVAKAFGISVNNHDYDSYWDSIIERIFEAKWWNSRRPRAGMEQKVWDGRTAFLDAIFYEPVSRTKGLPA